MVSRVYPGLSRRVFLVLLASMLVVPGLAAAPLSLPTASSDLPTAVVAPSQAGSPSAMSDSPSLRHHTPPPNANYDEQIGMTFTQNFTSMAYNVTAVEQTDPTLGTGPGYLLSGVSTAGYWYQVGLSWDWSPGAGFAMSYEVFDSSGNSIYPSNGGGGLLGFSGTVNPGDNVTLDLYFNGSGQVVMLADDARTDASAQVTYAAEGSASFVGQPSSDANSNGFFTGLMTEWYHGAPYYSNPQEVLYSSNLSLSSAWLWMDEFNANSNQLLFASNATALTTFSSNPEQLQGFSYTGITEFADASEFITGAASNSTTTTSNTTTSTATTAVTTTDTVTTTIPVTITQTTTTTVPATVTQTTTVTQPVTTTATTTVTDTATSTASPTTTTITQTTTQTQTAPATQSLPVWTYGLMVLLLIGGLAVGYLVKRPQVGRPQTEETPVR
jgi:hypothetical protein